MFVFEILTYKPVYAYKLPHTFNTVNILLNKIMIALLIYYNLYIIFNKKLIDKNKFNNIYLYYGKILAII